MTTHPFDPQSLGSPFAEDIPPLPAQLQPAPLPGFLKGEKYLGGPIPLTWLTPAASLPGKALHVALALWFEALVSRGKKPTVHPRLVTLRAFGAGCRRTLYRALAALSRAGLVSVEYRKGRPSLVTILPPPQQRPPT